jgi:hypothetical protein
MEWAFGFFSTPIQLFWGAAIGVRRCSEKDFLPIVCKFVDYFYVGFVGLCCVIPTVPFRSLDDKYRNKSRERNLQAPEVTSTEHVPMRFTVDCVAVKRQSYSCNRPWRPIGLWDVEDPTFSRQSAHRWRWGCQPYAPAALYPPGIFLVLISVTGCVDSRAHSAAARIRSIQKSNDFIGNRTRDLPACSIATMLPRAPHCIPATILFMKFFLCIKTPFLRTVTRKRLVKADWEGCSDLWSVEIAIAL